MCVELQSNLFTVALLITSSLHSNMSSGHRCIHEHSNCIGCNNKTDNNSEHFETGLMLKIGSTVFVICSAQYSLCELIICTMYVKEQ